MPYKSKISHKRRGIYAVALLLPLALAACGQSQQVEPDDLVKPDPKFSKLGSDPVVVE